MLLEEPGGATRSVLVPAGTAYRRSEGVEHNVICDGPGMSFVEVELKSTGLPGISRVGRWSLDASACAAGMDCFPRRPAEFDIDRMVSL
jgi:hypothetical protein